MPPEDFAQSTAQAVSHYGATRAARDGDPNPRTLARAGS